MLKALQNPTKTSERKSEVGVKHFRLIERTYSNNKDSDFTERIEALGKKFNYQDNSQALWGNEEFSTFYGTPLFEQCSQSQRLGLNHLYWVGQYNHTAGAEANTMLYNQITSGVFANIPGYETLCAELDFETFQERFHINTFQRIGYKTKVALLGKESLKTPLQKKLKKRASPAASSSSLNRFLKLPSSSFFEQADSFTWERFQEAGLRWISGTFLGGRAQYYSKYLQERDERSIPTTIGGLAGITASPTMFKFMSLNWGSSPFLAAQYYSARMIANMSLKAYEYSYYSRFTKLNRQDATIPVPTEVSHYHLRDEAFHTTMSQVIAQEVYKDFAAPNPYEKLVANLIIYLAQQGILSGLSGGLPAVFRDDVSFMPSFYRLLKSPLFGMTHQEALHWIKQCLCVEHQGFQENLLLHEKLLADFQNFFGRLEYLWPVNRDMQIMQAGGSVDRAIRRNRTAFKQFEAITAN